MNDRFDLNGRVAVVTGGSRGLGRSMAQAFAEHGAHVVIASRNVESCEEVASSIRESTGREALGLRYHAASWNDADALADTVYERFGRCDVLVNNAGMSPLYGSLSEVSEELFDKVLGVNFKGPFRLSSLIGERMAATHGGSMIHISSIAAVVPNPRELVYASAKSALNAMSSGLAHAFAPAVRSNVIMPGPFLTDIADSWPTEIHDMLQQLPLRRGGEPDEIVGAALYLASDASSYTTGAVLKIDGGAAWAPA